MEFKRTKKTINGVRINGYLVNEVFFTSKKDALNSLGMNKPKRKSVDCSTKRSRLIEGSENMSVAEYKKAYNRRYADINNVKASKQRSKRIVAWFSEWDEFVLEEATDLARRRFYNTGFKWDVDHMLPLQSKLVSGLHCAENLQVIPATMNRTKHNKMMYTERLEWLDELKA